MNLAHNSLRAGIRKQLQLSVFPHSRRPFSWNAAVHPVETLSGAFLNLGHTLSTLPLPEYLPPYAAAIILSTVALRTCVTLPVAIWSRGRVQRMREIVQPDFKEAQLQLIRDLKKHSLEKGIKVDKPLFDQFQKDTAPELAKFREKLIKKHRCSPLPTFLVPLGIHVPVFITASLALRLASVPPTPLSAESFFSETSLALTDPTGFFPIAVGVVSLLNFEMSRRWFTTLRENKQWWEKHIENAMRGASVGIICVSAFSPGSVTLYWFTSSLYTLFQTGIFGLIDQRREGATLSTPVIPTPNTKIPPQALQQKS